MKGATGCLMWGLTMLALPLALGIVLIYGECAVEGVLTGGCNWADLFLGDEGYRPDPFNVGLTVVGLAACGFLWWRFNDEWRD